MLIKRDLIQGIRSYKTIGKTKDAGSKLGLQELCPEWSPRGVTTSEIVLKTNTPYCQSGDRKAIEKPVPSPGSPESAGEKPPQLCWQQKHSKRKAQPHLHPQMSHEASSWQNLTLIRAPECKGIWNGSCLLS